MDARRVMVERNVQRYLRRQHALISTKQAIEAGLSRPALKRRVDAGRLGRVASGLYRDLSQPVTQHQRILAATLVHSGDAFASHQSGAWLYRVDGYRPGGVHLAASDAASQRNPLAVVHQLAGLTPSDTRRVDGIPCLSPELTLFTLAAKLDFDDLEVVFVDMACKRLLTTESVLDTLNRFGRSGRNGTVVLRKVAQRWDGERLPGSPPELKLGRILESRGYQVDYQRRLEDVNDRERFADLAITGLPIVVEFQSEKHHSARKAMRNDSTRTLRLTAVGLHVLPASQADIDNDGVDVVAAIEAIIRGRAA